jgi:carbon storage regulator CsrA
MAPPRALSVPFVQHAFVHRHASNSRMHAPNGRAFAIAPNDASCFAIAALGLHAGGCHPLRITRDSILSAPIFREEVAMLVLSRKQGQQLKIGDHITVTVLEVRGHRIRVGIEAPGSMRVLRGELNDWDVRAPGKRPDRRAVALAS